MFPLALFYSEGLVSRVATGHESFLRSGSLFLLHGKELSLLCMGRGEKILERG